jgi:hypothetical protein
MGRPASETVARREAGLEPTGTYLRRVSEAGLPIHFSTAMLSGRQPSSKVFLEVP